MSKVKNPLRKRIPRELKGDFGKYLVIFIFMVGMIGIVSGFLVANQSISNAYDESFQKYNMEDGNFELASKADSKLIDTLEKEDVKIYDNFYVEEETKEVDSTLRIFANRTDIDRACVMEGRLAENKDEIAIDRMYAENNNIKVGDMLTVGNKKLNVVGLI
ncbi:MAG: ABC transporter permease, partial [Oscillospiraceae bacterium]|nr:ABC transporter permease [Oscillospiraceae bacterium]